MLEGLIFICGPLSTLAVAMYPLTGGASSLFTVFNRALAYVAIALSVAAILGAVRTPSRKATGLLVSVVLFYAALFMSSIGGIIPAFPEVYWTTPLVVFAFLFNQRYSLEWLLRMARIAVRVIVILSFAMLFVAPETAFNIEEARTVFGFHRMQGIVAHPNGFSAIAGFGFLLELHSRSKIAWRILFTLAIVLAQSTTAYIAIVTGLLVMHTVLGKFLRFSLYIAGVALLSLAAFGGNGFLSQLLPEKASTLTGRTDIWAAALYGFQQSPIWGYGPTLLGDEYRSMYLPNFDAAAQAHNQWIQTLGGEGLVGLFSLMILTTVMLVYAVRSRVATSGLSMAMVLFLVVRCVTETPLRPSGFNIMTLMLVVTLCTLAASDRGPLLGAGESDPQTARKNYQGRPHATFSKVRARGLERRLQSARRHDSPSP